MVGTLAKSQKTKFDEIEELADYPFVEYRVKNIRVHFAAQHRTEIVVRKLVIQAYDQLKTNIYF